MAHSTTVVSMDNMDYISFLPDEIIHAHILTKLFTKEAARTSVLSKRWSSLWSSLPYLEFYQFHFLHTSAFRDFVDQTLRDRQRTETDILKFKLCVTHGIEVSDFDDWIRLVMERNVQEFHLEFLGIQPYKWPSQNVCIAKTLTVLELYYCEVKFESNMMLHQLQVLSLEKVLLDERTIEIFIRGCPSMKDVKVSNCYGLKHLNVSNHLQLKRLYIGNCFGLMKVSIIQVPSLESLTLYFTKSFVSLNPLCFKVDPKAYETLRELHLCNYHIEDKAFQDFLSRLSNLECLILKNVVQYSSSIAISSKKLKRLELEHCGFFMVEIRVPNLTSLKYENNETLFYHLETYNVQDYIFSDCCDYSTNLDEKSLKFEPVQRLLANSSRNLWQGTKMVVDMKWCNYVIVLEDCESIAQLPYEVIDDLFPKAMCISNMSFPQMVEWFLNHSLCFGQKLLVISSADSKFYKVLQEKRPNYYLKSSTFTMTKEAFERNTHLLSIDNVHGENDQKYAFFAALLEVGFNKMQAVVLEKL
ncbi:hypothetical protein RIF29_29524 [Crotalaria pallida]|uniref:F-box domain-containing protein n=1 Tax=Crotalaria pallida TaxID=3830 RepID=A0AAN9HXJ4_CROPI